MSIMPLATPVSTFDNSGGGNVNLCAWSIPYLLASAFFPSYIEGISVEPGLVDPVEQYSRSGYGLGKESERLNENRHRMELIGSPLLKKRRRRAQGSTSSSYYDYVSFDYRDLAHSMPSTKEVFSTSGSSVEWKPPKEKNATLSKGEGRAKEIPIFFDGMVKGFQSRLILLDRMGPNKLSTFVPAANKSEVSLESELAALVLVQDRKVWDRLLMALEASNRPGRSRSEVRESKSYLFLSSLSALLLEVGV
ncbi:unnamed protein product [Dovyalis caffra]|uniref:Uncharacterized protein n=1 Tax=Dovyalis caffra TaxID=77055 RepID=A0AAV1QQV6_9ROSI|nr:unnamed protein product [Dovyalis caffra]